MSGFPKRKESDCDCFDTRQALCTGGGSWRWNRPVDYRGTSFGVAVGGIDAAGHALSVGYAVYLRLLCGMRVHGQSDYRRYFPCRRRFPVRTCLRCERYVACRRTGRSVGGFRVEVAGIGGLCFAEYRRMHQDDSCFAALSKVSLGQQCDETDRFRRSIKRMKNR